MKNLISKKGIICIAVILKIIATPGIGYAQNDIDSISIQALSACGIPNNLHIINLSSTSGQLIWNSVSNATNYVIRYRRLGTSSWQILTSHNALETLYNLTPNSQYEAKVRCDCGNIEGNYSGLFNFTTLSNGSCAIPNIYYFTSGNITSNSCLLGWKNISGAMGYYVRYRIRYSGFPWLLDSSSTNSLLLTGLFPSTGYEFCVQTICGGGTGNFSAPGIFKTTNGGCNPPDSLSAANITDSSAILSWNFSACAAYYIVNYRQAGLSWNFDTTSQLSYNLSGLASDTVFEFYVQSVDSSGNPSSLSQTYVFNNFVNSCGTVINADDSIVTNNSAILTWDVVSGAVKYKINYRLTGSSMWEIDSTLINNISISGLDPNSNYEYRVQAICSATAGLFSSTENFTTLSIGGSNIPVPDHIVICILENKAYTQIIGSSLTPHINSLANDSMSTLFTQSYALTHPSQPNYIHLFSGSNQGINGNSTPANHFTTPNLARELIDAGRTYKSYCEGLPSIGFDGTSSGDYARKHNPVANWMGTGINQVSPALNQPFSSFPSNYDLLPTVSIISPDLNNSMHDGSVSTALPNGDSWLYQNLFPYIQWAKTHNSLFILTFDEDDGNHNNRIATIFTGEMINPGTNSQHITHYNILRMIEEMYGLNFIGGSANVTSIHGCWNNGFRTANLMSELNTFETNETESGWKIFPNPASNELNVLIDLPENSLVTLHFFSETGALVYVENFGDVAAGIHTYTISLPPDRFPSGVYLIRIIYGNRSKSQKLTISR